MMNSMRAKPMPCAGSRHQRKAASAGHGDHLTLRQLLRRIGRTHDRGEAELAAHDRRVRGPSALVGHDRAEAVLPEQGLEDYVAVGVGLAGHDHLAQPPGGVDGHHVREPRPGIEGEREAGTREIRADRALHSGGKRDVEMAEPVLLDDRFEAVVRHERAVGIGRGREALRHPDAFGLQLLGHLSEGGIPAADARDVVAGEVREPADMF